MWIQINYGHNTDNHEVFCNQNFKIEKAMTQVCSPETLFLKCNLWWWIRTSFAMNHGRWDEFNTKSTSLSMLTESYVISQS